MFARRFLTGALAAGALFACSEGTAPRQSHDTAEQGPPTSLGDRVALGRHVRVLRWQRALADPVTGSATLGPRGGTIKVGTLATFTVPAGALTRNTTITVTALPGRHVVFQGQPSGLQFATPATLAIFLANTNGRGQVKLRGTLLGGYIASPEQIGSDDGVDDSEDNPAATDVLFSKVTLPVPHFSVVILASQRTTGWDGGAQ